MSHSPSTEHPTMRRAAPEDEVTVRFVLPQAMVSESNAGLQIRTCRGGVIAIPPSVLAKGQNYANAQTTEPANFRVFEARTRRDVADFVSNLIAEVVRLTGEIQAHQGDSSTKSP